MSRRNRNKKDKQMEETKVETVVEETQETETVIEGAEETVESETEVQVDEGTDEGEETEKEAPVVIEERKIDPVETPVVTAVEETTVDVEKYPHGGVIKNLRERTDLNDDDRMRMVNMFLSNVMSELDKEDYTEAEPVIIDLLETFRKNDGLDVTLLQFDHVWKFGGGRKDALGMLVTILSESAKDLKAFAKLFSVEHGLRQIDIPSNTRNNLITFFRQRTQ